VKPQWKPPAERGWPDAAAAPAAAPAVELVKGAPAAALSTTNNNPVVGKLSQILQQLPEALYRTVVTISRITVDPTTGQEKAVLVHTEAFDFEAVPPGRQLEGKVSP